MPFVHHDPHGAHLRSQKAHDVRAVEPHGEAVRPHRQGHHDGREGRWPGPDVQSRSAPDDPECARGQHAEGQDRGGIRRASGRDAANYQQVLYEGYAPHGVALLVETATDNPTRTVAAVRNVITKNGGNLATSGSVSFLFRKMGVFRLSPEGLDQDDLELYLIDHGLDEMGESTGEKGEPQLVIRCAFADFGSLQEALEARGLTPLSAEHEYVCTVPSELPEDQATEVLTLIDRLEQDEDVQKVFHTLA
jgi:YebC/PmpR family DNA-binding regulatory protein